MLFQKQSIHIYKRILAHLYFIVFLTGCAQRENMEIQKSVFATPKSVVIAQMWGLEEPHFYKFGNQGIIGFAFNSAMTDDLQTVISQIDVKPVVEEHYYLPFQKAFEAKSFKVTRAGPSYKREELSDPPESGDKYAHHDFRFLKTQHNADYALILRPGIFGVQRKYYSMVPLGQPKGWINLQISLVNLEDNSILGHFGTTVEQPIEGEWDTPPHFPEVVKAVKDAVKIALNKAYTHFFGVASQL